MWFYLEKLYTIIKTILKYLIQFILLAQNSSLIQVLNEPTLQWAVSELPTHIVTRIFKNLKFKKLSRDWSQLQKVRKQGIIFWQDIFKSLIPTFSLLQWVNMIKKCLPKVGIELFKISCQNIIPCFLTFCSSDQSLLSFFLNFKFLNILVCLLFIVYLYKYIT